MMRAVVIIPAYNEEVTVGAVVRQTLIHNSRFMIRTIVVDDGSTDRTAQVAHAAGAIVLRHPINRGLGAALSTGIEGALLSLRDGDSSLSDGVIVTLDADLQHDPSEIPRMIEPILQGQAEVVIGTRFKRRMQNAECRMPFVRMVANYCGNIVTWLLFGIWVSDSQSGFRAFSAPAAAKLQLRTSTMEVSSEIIREIARLKLKMVEIPITAQYSKYSLSKGQGFVKGIETLGKLIALRFFR